ncbi:glycosyltransferase family 4 protein [Rhizobium sp. S95]|uniref:Glycosyltransferase family 4 protein n=1 Tax=Ciceribacter sichuanensis TaxID=2949647 RepID=A0AAJ1F7H6_9HYPH|nr:glycosyltransferase family 4 protein [Ciceribacter sp. S95]MCO5959990.1 glycosyltransferase family 4 protein [Ciceribacter sp. S101]
MRVLHFFKTYWPDTFGGVERTIHAIARGGRKYGIDAEILSLSTNPEQNSLNFDGSFAHKAKLDFQFASTGFSTEAFSRFKELSAQADVIHYHFPWPFMDLVHLWTSPKAATVVTYHSDIVKQKFLLQLYKPIMHKFLGSVDCICATSPAYTETSPVLSEYKDKTSVIPLGLDEADYPHATPEELLRWQQKFKHPFFLFVGVLRYYKGLHTLLVAAKKVDADILIVGAGPMEKSLKAMSEQLGLHNVHFLGSLPDASKSALLELCTAFAFPSHLRSEAFGLSLVEASMFGKPMISTNIGTGTSYVNLDGETGFVVSPDDANALAQAMQDCLQQPERMHQLGANARKRFEAQFTADKMCERYASVYEVALRKKSSATR